MTPYLPKSSWVPGMPLQTSVSQECHASLTETPGYGSTEERPHPIGIELEQCAQRGVSPMRLQIVPGGRDGAEEYGDFPLSLHSQRNGRRASYPSDPQPFQHLKEIDDG
jgi:hypothetical protein